MGIHRVDEPGQPLHETKQQAFVLLWHGEGGHKNRMPENRQERTGARAAVALLLGINLICYLDRYILAAILPAIKAEFLPGDPQANGKAGLLTTAFLVSYMLTAPVFGWMADRFSRWLIIALSVALWSLASGASGLAAGFGALLATRVFLGIGEAGYGPAAPSILSDLFPVERRGRVLAWFYMAIPVGSALGYAFGGLVGERLGWRWAFYLVTPPGLLLAGLCFLMREPRAPPASRKSPPRKQLGRIMPASSASAPWF